MSLTKARPWLIGLAAAATMLVLILAIGNPPVTRTIFEHADTANFSARVLQSIGAFFWDFARLGDNQNLYLANLVFDIAVVVVVLLLVAALSSGKGSFWRTLLAAWVSVIVAVLLSDYLRAAIIDPMGTVPNKAEAIFFSQYSPGALQMFAALLFGLIVALVAALVAVLTRRREVVTAEQPMRPPTPAAEPEQPAAAPRREAWAAPPAAVPGPVADPSPWSTTDDRGDDQDRTTQLPAVGSYRHQDLEADDSEHTRALPRVEDDRPHN